MNRLRTLFSLLLFCLTITACAAEEESVVLEPLDRNVWPTAAPPTAAITPTPFPTVETTFRDTIVSHELAKKTPPAVDDAAPNEAVAQAEAATATPTVIVPPTATPSPTPVAPTVAADTNADTTASQEEDVLAAVEATLTSDSGSTETVVPQNGLTAFVASFGLNLRSGSGTEANVIRQLSQGDQVTIIADSPGSDWVQIRTASGQEGWVNAAYLTIQGSIDQLDQSQTTQTDQQPAPTATAIPTATPPQSTAASEPATSAPENTSGRLLIQPQSGGPIMIINRDGTGLRRITTGIDPALSPDGSKIAFTRWDGANQGSLWVANTNGSGERQIVGDIRQAKSPSWSPDSQRIAINFQEGGTLDPTRHCQGFEDGEPDINFWTAYDIELQYKDFGGGPVPVGICWSLPPDPHWKLKVVNLTDQTSVDMPAGQYAFAPTWDPANPWRVVSADRFGLVWTDVNRGVAETLTNDPFDRAPTFSADGRFLAVTYKQSDHWEVHRLNADGTGRVRLTKTPLYAIVDGPQQWNNAAPVFSPDGSEIAFLSDRSGRWEVWVMNVDGSNQRPMFSEAVNNQLEIFYHGNDARMLGWGK